MLSLAFALAAIVVSALGANDWNTPCTSGACGFVWDADGVKTAFSSMMLAGPNQVLSDITPAAGWNVMGCDPNWSSGSHDIRMVCAGTPEQIQHCQHLYDNGGAEETVVRLPQNCGTGPFARVQKTYVPDDQSIPASVTRRGVLPRSNGTAANSTQPAVRGLTLDYNFNAIPNSRGKLVMGIASSNVGTKPLTRRDLTNLRQRGRVRATAQRDFLGNLVNGVEGAFSDVQSVAGDATSAVGAGIDKATSVVASVATAAATAVVNGVHDVQKATTINKTDTSAAIPINVDDSFTLLDANIACGAGKASGSASLHIDVEPKVSANIKFGYTFVGSVVPLKLDDVSVFSSMSGDASATFNINAEAQGSFDTGSVPLFKSGLPGLTIPGIATLGPEFSLNGQLQMQLDVEAQMSVTADFAFPDVELVFPEKNGKSSGKANANKGSNPVKLSTQQNVDVTGTITAHILPRVDFGIDIGEGLAKASVFLDMDIAGTLGLEVNAGGTSSGTIGGAAAVAKNAANATSAATTAEKSGAASKTTAAKSASDSAKATSKAPPPKAPPAKAAPAKATPKTAAITSSKKAPPKRATTGGCVTLTGNLSINGGLEGTLEPLFDKQVNFPIFSTQANLFQKCFGNQKAAGPTGRSISGGSTVARMYRYRSRATLAKATPAKASGGTKNEITPSQSKASTKQLTCGSTVVPLGGLSSLI